ncbi:uncharacterized protein LOC113003752 [Solenopsis invicta]|uniref:uncharacterized protein LOC113003752 n=1 Tax=Solenopsis invicta TaxID=13686 RepID=UPI00193E77B0|nr:uncharacterized protein LOC113003752 [Solenopsis invicta]
MVWKCCVPGCTSSARVPSHKLPTQHIKMQAWLKTIGLDNLINAPKDVTAKLRICALHFPEEMIKPYGQKRCLKDNAMPILFLNSNIVADGANISFTDNGTIATLQPSDDVEGNSDFVPVASTSTAEEVQLTDKIKYMNITKDIVPRRITQLQAKVRRYRKLLSKRNKTISKYKEKEKDIRRRRTWEDVNANLSGVQKTFFEMISRNFSHAPEVCSLINKKLFLGKIFLFI